MAAVSCGFWCVSDVCFQRLSPLPHLDYRFQSQPFSCAKLRVGRRCRWHGGKRASLASKVATPCSPCFSRLRLFHPLFCHARCLLLSFVLYKSSGAVQVAPFPRSSDCTFFLKGAVQVAPFLRSPGCTFFLRGAVQVVPLSCKCLICFSPALF